MFALLVQRNFLLLWVAHTISILGDYVFFIAITFWIYELTGSASATGAVLIISTAPMVLFAPLAGLVVDRWDRRRIMFVAEGARALLFLSLLCAVLVQPSTLWPIYLVAFIQSALAAFFWPARGAMLPQMIESSALLTSNALYMASDSVVRIIAPSLSAFVLLRLGPSGVIIVDAASFIISAGSICLLTPIVSQQVEGILLRRGRHGLKGNRVASPHVDARTNGGGYAGASHHIVGLLVLSALVAYVAGTLSILLPVFVHTVLQAGPLAYGWMLTGQALGEGGMSLLVGPLLRGRARAISFVSGCLVVGGLVLIFLARIHMLLLGLLLNMVFGAVMAASSIQLLTWLQKSSDRRFSGKVLATYTGVQALAQVVGMGLVGALVGGVGVLWLMVFDGGLYIVGGGLIWLLL